MGLLVSDGLLLFCEDPDIATAVSVPVEGAAPARGAECVAFSDNQRGAFGRARMERTRRTRPPCSWLGCLAIW
jgi:hypothetical protein